MKCPQFFLIGAPGVLLWLVVSAKAGDWPQWRGPNRDGVWSEQGIIESFPSGGLKMLWRAQVGTGFSSPVVADGRVYVTDSQISKPKARERVLCFDAKTGNSLWSHSYEVDYAEWAFDPKNPFGPRSTPIVSGGRLFTLGARGHLICFDAASGKVLWQKGLENKDKDSVFSSSPLIEGNLLILVLDGGPPGPCVLGLSKDSGAEVWNALEGVPTVGSPIVIVVGGRKQLVVWTKGFVSALDPATGKLHWRERHLSGGTYSVPTPVAQRELLWVNGIMYKVESDSVKVLWPDGRPASRRMTSETSSALFQDDNLFTCNLSGELICIAAKTGHILWATNQVTDAKSGGSIHITANDDSAFLFNDKGELIRAELAAAGYKEISRASLLRPTFPHGDRKMAWTPPAYANRCVFARSDEELVCASLAQ